jgi:hypothetical protein
LAAFELYGFLLYISSVLFIKYLAAEKPGKKISFNPINQQKGKIQSKTRKSPQTYLWSINFSNKVVHKRRTVIYYTRLRENLHDPRDRIMTDFPKKIREIITD